MLDTSLAPVNADLSSYSLNEISATRIEMIGALQTFSWLGLHTIKIKSTNGKRNTDSTARGKEGLFRSLLSEEMQIKIVNPCLNTVVNADKGLVLDYIRVPIMQSYLLLSLPGPTDSISVRYGNGHDKCGELTYLWLNDLGD